MEIHKHNTQSLESMEVLVVGFKPFRPFCNAAQSSVLMS